MATIRILRRGIDGVIADDQAKGVLECLGHYLGGTIVDAGGVIPGGNDVLPAGGYSFLTDTDTDTDSFFDWKEDMDVVSSRISRLTVVSDDESGEEEACLGTAVRVSTDGLLVAPRNGLIDTTSAGGTKLKHPVGRVRSFGARVDVVAAHPDSQIVLLQGQPGPAFSVTPNTPREGDRVYLAGFKAPADWPVVVPESAAAAEEDHIDPETVDAIRPGYVSCVNASSSLGAANFAPALGHGADPYLPGAAVLYSSGFLAGVHLTELLQAEGVTLFFVPSSAIRACVNAVGDRLQVAVAERSSASRLAKGLRSKTRIGTVARSSIMDGYCSVM